MTAIGRYVAFGSLFSAPVLFAWYRALDRLLPGAPGAALVAKKVLLDATVLAIPYYSAFYVAMDFMEVRVHLKISALNDSN